VIGESVVGTRGLLAMIEAAASSAGRVHFLPAEDSYSVTELWRLAHRAATRLRLLIGPEAPVAVVLDSSPAAVAVLLGAWRSGRRVVSVPLPPRGSSLDWYQRFVEDACAAGGAPLLLVAGSVVPVLPPMQMACSSFEDVVEGRAPGRFDERFHEGELVQFTSGSTGQPKGVVLGIDAVAANVSAILEVIDPVPGDGACSWLPLSHDMGLIGVLLTSLCASGPDRANGGDLVLIRPDWFLRRPESWLDACSNFGSTITAAPDFGFGLAVRRGAGRSIDLRRLRVCITGAERVRPATLRRFTRAFEAHGFDDRAFCPAYGLAEAGLAVTMTRPEVTWSALPVGPETLDDAGAVPIASCDGEVVSCGEALPGYATRIAAVDDQSRAGHQVGAVEVTGPSLFRGYLPGAPRRQGWFATNDRAFMVGRELFVTGRLDDVVVLAGRNVHLGDVDAAIVSGAGIPAGRVQSTASEGGFRVVAEAVDHLGPEALASAVRRAAVAAIGWSPDEVVVVERGTLPRTASGKPRRHELARGLDADDVPVSHRLQVR
jgi:acyl-CoA synthetase (AMP-forming)/AMP-acid ligase II